MKRGKKRRRVYFGHCCPEHPDINIIYDEDTHEQIKPEEIIGRRIIKVEEGIEVLILTLER